MMIKSSWYRTRCSCCWSNYLTWRKVQRSDLRGHCSILEIASPGGTRAQSNEDAGARWHERNPRCASTPSSRVTAGKHVAQAGATGRGPVSLAFDAAASFLQV